VAATEKSVAATGQISLATGVTSGAVAAIQGEPDELYAALAAGHDPPASFAERLAALRPTWHQHAACRGMGAGPWFPERGSDSTTGKAVCAGCPVRAQCLDAALALDEVGTWGGLSRPERLQVGRSAA